LGGLMTGGGGGGGTPRIFHRRRRRRGFMVGGGGVGKRDIGNVGIKKFWQRLRVTPASRRRRGGSVTPARA